MKLNVAYVACLIFAVVAVVLFASVALEQSFPIFNSTQTASSVNVNGDVGAQDSAFLWNNTGIAVLAQAFVLFAAAAATLGLLKTREENNNA